MLWMERFALYLFVLFFIFMFGLDWLVAPDNKFPTEDILEILKGSFIFAIVIWIGFRLIDFMFAGPLRRKFKRENCPK